MIVVVLALLIGIVIYDLIIDAMCYEFFKELKNYFKGVSNK